MLEVSTFYGRPVFSRYAATIPQLPPPGRRAREKFKCSPAVETAPVRRSATLPDIGSGRSSALTGGLSLKSGLRTPSSPAKTIAMATPRVIRTHRSPADSAPDSPAESALPSSDALW
jgi:hypothetical protein